MRKVVIESSQRTTLRLVSTGEGKSGSALSPFGPVRAGLITMQSTNKDQALTELLSSLEKKIVDLNTKSYAVLNIFLHGTTHLAEPIVSSSGKTITD